ncbi:CBS domain-containing protein [Candidatus Micrarchaeota archaeon]|nr:CBS domain-containing protein [Candidatus Micrarchaeota archaeon]
MNKVMESAFFVDEKEQISKVIHSLAKSGCVVVLKEGKYFGMVDDRTLRGFSGDATRESIGRIAETPAILALDSPPEQVILAFLNSKSKALPVLDKERVVGVITRGGALQLLEKSSSLADKKVLQYMSSPPIVIHEKEPVDKARALMKEHGICRLIVVDDHGKASGILTSYDFATKVIPYYRTPFKDSLLMQTKKEGVQKETVSSIMSLSPVSIEKNASLVEAVKKMLERKVLSLIVGGEAPEGILTTRDVFEGCTTIPSEKIIVYGLREDEKVLKQSLVEACSAFIEKMSKSIPIDYLALHIKSAQEGLKRRYEVKARVSSGGKMFAARDPNLKMHKGVWNPHLAVSEVFDELERILRKEVSARKRLKRW